MLTRREELAMIVRGLEADIEDRRKVQDAPGRYVPNSFFVETLRRVGLKVSYQRKLQEARRPVSPMNARRMHARSATLLKMSQSTHEHALRLEVEEAEKEKALARESKGIVGLFGCAFVGSKLGWVCR